jgi:hypothetical protein
VIHAAAMAHQRPSSLLDAPDAWLVQVLCSKVLGRADHEHVMSTCWAMFEAVLRCVEMGRLQVEVSEAGKRSSTFSLSSNTATTTFTTPAVAYRKHGATLRSTCLYTQLSDAYTGSQLACWRRALNVAPNLRLQFCSHGKAT